MQTIYSFLLLLIFTNVVSCKKENTIKNTTITIGGLFSLTGNWASLGIASQEAMSLAIKDINSYMVQTGSTYRFSMSVFDTKLDTVLAQVALKEAFSKNIHSVIGPQSSSELGAIRSFANANNILVVSQGSTASNLAIADDAIFRFCPGDKVEGKALSQTIYAQGIRSLITLARNDLGNKGLQNSVGFSFSELGGTTDPISPYEIDLTDYSSILATLKSKIEQFALKSGVGQVGVYLASFDECASLFEQASVDPVFSSVRWFGGDGAAFSNALLSSSNASSFAEVTHFIVPNFGLPQQVNPNLAVVAAAIKIKTGSDPDAYALSVYDATWVIAKSEAAFPNSSVDFSTLKSVFLAEADRFYGITGPIVLNAAGDRSVGSFDYWGIVTENGLFKWKLMGKSL